MKGSDISVRPYEGRFAKDLVEVCWRTGLMGESLEGTGRFEDRKLFGLLWLRQYLHSWPELAWIAVRPEGGRERAVGYIISAPDATRQARDFGRLAGWRWRIVLRLFGVSLWRYPESFRQTLAFARGNFRELWADPAYLPDDYPANLHMNLLPDCQGRGVGTRLMETLLAELERRGLPGVHLGTSDRNIKALPFYEKMGFRRVREVEGESWIGLPAKGIDYALALPRSRTVEKPRNQARP